MKRFAVTLAVVGMVMLFATFAVGFYAWAPYASWGGGGTAAVHRAAVTVEATAAARAVATGRQLFKQRHGLRLWHAAAITAALRLRVAAVAAVTTVRRRLLAHPAAVVTTTAAMAHPAAGLQLRRLWLIEQQRRLLACEQLFQRLVLID